MDLPKLFEADEDRFCLFIMAGETGVDDAITELEHEPNGYFWESVAKLLMATHSPALEERLDFDCEPAAFWVYSEDVEALKKLAALMRPFTEDPDRMGWLIASAEETGFDFNER